MRNLLLIFYLFVFSFSHSQSCVHTIQLTDTYGDGWNGGRVAVSVNGLTVLSNLGSTFTNGYGPISFTFMASAGQTIRVYRTTNGTFHSEMRIRVISSTGATIINTVQPALGSATSGGNIGFAQCSAGPPPAPSGCTNIYAYGSAVAPSTNTPVTISTCVFQEEYSTVSSIVSGRTYQFTYNLGGYITIRTGTYNGPVVAQGSAPLTWTSNYNGTIYVHYNTNSSCGTAFNCGTNTVVCTSCTGPVAPANDLVCNATNINCGQTISGTTINATNTGTGENGFCSVSQTMPGVWYVIPGNGQLMTANLCATAWDSKISVFSGPNCSSLTCVGGNDDWGPSCSSSSASFSWASTAGTNYYILVHGYSSSSAFQLGLLCSTPPPNNPTSISQTANPICAGNSTTLTANGVIGTVYWYTSGCGVTQIGTGNSITVSPNATTTYYARNFNGGLFSNGCVSSTVTVNATPIATITPTANTICNGTSTQLNINITGVSAGAALVYSWSPGNTLTNPNASSPLASPSTTQTYTLTVTANGCSNTAQTTISVNPSVGFVSTISGNNTIIAGTQETYLITPVANSTYQWAYTESITAPLWLNIPNSNSPSISFYWTQTTTDGSVRVTVSNSSNCGTQVRFFNIITNGALPVELLSFDGTCNENVITLNWSTASEHNSDYFEILKSGDGNSWSSVDKIPAAGNSTVKIDYQMVDSDRSIGDNYYILKQVDIDGVYKEYGPIHISCKNLGGYFSAFPNPSTGNFMVVLNDSKMIGDATIFIEDSKGSRVFSKAIKVNAGINLYSIENASLSAGLYYISVYSNGVYTEKIKEVIR